MPSFETLAGEALCWGGDLEKRKTFYFMRTLQGNNKLQSFSEELFGKPRPCLKTCCLFIVYVSITNISNKRASGQWSLPVSVTLSTETLWVAGPLSRLLWSRWGLGGTRWTGQIQDRRTVVALLLLALPGVVFSYYLLFAKKTTSSHQTLPFHSICASSRYHYWTARDKLSLLCRWYPVISLHKVN